LIIIRANVLNRNTIAGLEERLLQATKAIAKKDEDIASLQQQVCLRLAT